MVDVVVEVVVQLEEEKLTFSSAAISVTVYEGALSVRSGDTLVATFNPGSWRYFYQIASRVVPDKGVSS